MARRCCLLLILVGVIFGEDPSQRSSIEGFVTSEITAPVPGAIVGIDSAMRSSHRETATNTSGYYFLGDLNPGAYSLWAEVKGFGCILYPHVALFAGQRLRQDFHFARTKHYPGNCEPVIGKGK